MNYVKMLGLLAVAAAALMAFASSASATLTEGEGDPVDVGDTIHASSEGATSLTGTITITCQKSTLSGEVTENGASSAGGLLNTLTFEECGNHTITILEKASFKIHSPGTITFTNTKITILTHSFLLGTVHCILGGQTYHSGTSTGGSKATLDINSAAIPREATDGACGEHTTWEGSYSVSTPGTLLVD